MKRFSQHCEMAGSCGTDEITGIEVLGHTTLTLPESRRVVWQEPKLQIVFTNERGFSQPVYSDEHQARMLACVALNPLDVFTGGAVDQCVEKVVKSKRETATEWLREIVVRQEKAMCPASLGITYDGDTFTPKFTQKQLDLGLEELRARFYAPVLVDGIVPSS